VPPLFTVVPLVAPPDETVSVPPLSVVATAMPAAPTC
jgi:hypothetical protein